MVLQITPYLKILENPNFRYEGEKMANNPPALPKKKFELTKNQAITVMVLGAIMLAQAFFISAEVGTSIHYTKNIVAIIGIVILLVGVALRPVKAAPAAK